MRWLVAVSLRNRIVVVALAVLLVVAAFRVLRTIIVPLSVPAILAVALFHFSFSWNDFFLPLLYLSGKPELQTLPIAIQQYNALYATQPTLIQAAALMTMLVPVAVFFLAQRSFMRGVVVTGLDK